ncbi:MAG: glycosyltransferase family 39 protein [Lewinellaceae bacterium]|nr:glycosyltransferase family 39 protein [Saprospiraceae bacterium]MCB9331327.1 glycosyltransferase family 39 protein [Lewinellaceae bacterium]
MSNTTRYSLLFAFLGAIFYIPFLGGVHLFDWDEVNFAEISREMLILKDYLRIYVNFQPFWEKPPFFFWMQALAMQGFGVGEFAARLPNALFGVITLVLLFNIGQKLYNTRFGIIWATVYLGTVLPFLYFKSGIIDPMFNLFIFLGLYFFILSYWKKAGFSSIELPRNRWWYLFLGGFFIGMGILTKGQTAYLLAGLTMAVYWVYKRFRFYVNVPEFLFFTLAATLVTLAWYGLETWKNGPWFITEFNKYQFRLFSTPDAGHVGFPGYHFVMLLFGCFPASIFAMRAFFRQPDEQQDHQQDFRRWMKYLFWVVLILFSIVKSKIVHYSSMCYLPLSFLAAVVLDKILRGDIAFSTWMKVLLLTVGGVFVLATAALPFVGMNAEVLAPLFKDAFALASLGAAVHWTGWEILPALFLLSLLVLTLRWFGRGQRERGFYTLFGGTAVFIMLTLIFFIKRIEGYSQRAAIEFFESKAGQDVYCTTYAYKSYAQLFYFKKQPSANENAYNQDWLINGPVDKDVYIATKNYRAWALRDRKDMELLGEKNGFVFFRRARVVGSGN